MKGAPPVPTVLGPTPGTISEITGEIVDADAIEIGVLYSRAGQGVFDSVHYAIQCGERLTEKKAMMTKRGQWLAWLENNAGVLGFSNASTAQRMMKAAKTALTRDLDTIGFEEATQLNREIWGNNTTRATAQTGDNEWYTPAEYIEMVREVLGDIDLDPASTAEAQKVVKANDWVSADSNGLLQEWLGRVWLNPPYAQPLISEFVSKLIEEYSAGRTDSAIMLTNNSTDTAWWHEAANAASAICFTRGRIQFYKPAGGPSAPLQGQVFFYYGKNIEMFTLHFQEIGFVAVPR